MLMKRISLIGIVLAFALNHPAMAEDRLPKIPPEKYTDEQKKAADGSSKRERHPSSGLSSR